MILSNVFFVVVAVLVRNLFPFFDYFDFVTKAGLIIFLKVSLLTSNYCYQSSRFTSRMECSQTCVKRARYFTKQRQFIRQ